MKYLLSLVYYSFSQNTVSCVKHVCTFGCWVKEYSEDCEDYLNMLQCLLFCTTCGVEVNCKQGVFFKDFEHWTEELYQAVHEEVLFVVYGAVYKSSWVYVLV